jgi:hypothetical protein
MPARREIAHSPRETMFAPNPPGPSGPVSRARTAVTSFALTEYCRSHGSGKAARTSAAAASRVATSVTKTGVPKRRATVRRTPWSSGLPPADGSIPDVGLRASS